METVHRALLPQLCSCTANMAQKEEGDRQNQSHAELSQGHLIQMGFLWKVQPSHHREGEGDVLGLLDPCKMGRS